MRKFILLFGCTISALALVITGCKKEELRQLESGFVISDYPASCFNHTQDNGETGIDCGGPCQACPGASVPCTNTLNNISVTDGSNTVPYSSTITYSTNSSNGNYTVRGTMGSNSVEIIFEQQPTASGVFTADDSYFSFDGDVIVKYNLNNLGNLYPLYAYNDQPVYVNVSGGNIKIDLCNVTVAGTVGFNQTTRVLKGNLTTN